MLNMLLLLNLINFIDKKSKQANLVTNSNVNVASECSNNEKQRIAKLYTFHLSYFLAKIFLVIMVFKMCLFINRHLIG